MAKYFFEANKSDRKFTPSRHQLLGLLLAIVMVAVISSQKTYNTGSDPRGTLLVSQSLTQHGTVKLDTYDKAFLDTFSHQIHRKNGHIYNYFPVGTALLSTPFVAVANALGYDMTRDEHRTQLALTAIAALIIAFILYKTARLYLPKTESLLLTGLCWFGSSLVSTMGTALWSHDFAYVFSSAAIFLVIRPARHPQGLPTPILIGFFLFMAYLCRPTLALLAPVLLLYYFIHDKKNSLLAAFMLSFLLLGFMGWSRVEFSQILPDYYLPKRLEGGDFKTALYGNIFSPARGLLIYSPFIFISLLLSTVLASRNKALAKLSLITIVWPIAHLLSISQFPHWWAGWSFGPRLMVDALPGLFLGLFSSLSALGQQKRKPAHVILILSGLFAIYINTYQASFNTYAIQWNNEPNIDKYPEYLFDWRYPQFLHSESRQEARMAEFRSLQSPVFFSLIDISYDSPLATFDSFHEQEPDFRWSKGQRASITMILNRRDLRGNASLHADFLGNQRLAITLNGHLVYHGCIHGQTPDIRFNFHPDLLRPGLNTFTFDLPDAHKPASQDLRVLAMAFRKLSLR